MDTLLRRICALLVAAVAAYASYQHQRAFALEGGADAVSAALWPLSVDGLLVLASVGLLKTRHDDSSYRARVAAWSSFASGVLVSLAANIASAPSLEWQPVLVAGRPPVALLLAVELLAHRPQAQGQPEPRETDTEHVERAQPSNPVHVAVSDLLPAAIRIDENHWARCGRPASAETVRKQLRIGAAKARALTTIVRGMSRPDIAEALTTNTDEPLSPTRSEEAHTSQGRHVAN
ncbi:DUF2637 domain-containing protein [Kibdelosporangium banguiense]|uniref:DUF2637 domain-containing protein n=1 Tax=Kibdelosporangium banguiense TaxID=1365924 RepID=UPI003557C66E